MHSRPHPAGRACFGFALSVLVVPVLTTGLTAPAAAELVRQQIDYSHDELPCRGYLVYDSEQVTVDQPAPGVLVVPEWWGLNDYAKARADQLAELGYVAFAADMYGLEDDGSPRVTTEGSQASAWARELYDDVTTWRARGQAALSVLAAQPTVDSTKLGAIGFCFGGATVQQLAYGGADLSAVVSFHGSPVVPAQDELDDIQAAVLICHGAADPFDPLDKLRKAVDALELSEVDYEVALYGHAVHSFTNPEADGSFHPGAKYSETAEPRAWGAMKRWLREHFAEESIR